MSKLSILLCILALQVGSILSAFVDEMTTQNFEKLYQRADFMTTDYRTPEELFNDATRYKRDFTGATRWEQYTFLKYRWPNNTRYDTVFLMAYELVASSADHVRLGLAYSNDDVTYTAFTPEQTQKLVEVNSIGNYRRANYTLRAPAPFRFFRVEWTGCSQTNICRDYWSPSLGHLCAMDSRVESFSQELCFPNGLNPPNIDPTPNYCGVRMVNNFWDQHTYGNLVNMLGGATNGGGQVVTRQQWDCDGIGSGKLYLDPADPVPPATVSPSYYYTVFGPAGRSCFDCTNYPYLSFDVTAGAGTTFNIRLEEGSDDTCNNILPGGGMAIPSTLVHNFTSTNTHTFLIPTMSQSGPRTRLRSLVLDTFVNPSGINLFIDNIKFINPSVRPPLYIDRFNTNGATPPALNGFRARTDDAGSMRVYSISGNRLQLSPRRGNSIWYTELSCLPITQQFPSPALKFEVSADGPVDFDIVLTEGHQNCDPNQPNQIQATRSVQLSSYLNITTDTANLAHTVSIPLSAFNINLQRLHSLQIRQIRPYGVNIYLDDIRFGSADCLEYEPVPYPDYTPKPPYFGFNRNFLTRARRSVSDRTEL